jgi:hypothetical protein
MIFEHCPFETNQRYVVKKDIKFLTHVLKTGELVVFLNHTYDPKIGIQRFHFKTSDKKTINAWHVFENDNIKEEDWNKYFKKIKS